VASEPLLGRPFREELIEKGHQLSSVLVSMSEVVEALVRREVWSL